VVKGFGSAAQFAYNGAPARISSKRLGQGSVKAGKAELGDMSA